MGPPARCPACGTLWNHGLTCEDHFHQMLFWEAEYLAYGAEVHHLMVLGYHLQHPSLYSPDGLNEGKRLLTGFLEDGITPQAMRQRIGDKVASGNRTFTITARPGSQGSYANPVRWTMTAADVTRASVHDYCDNVRA